MEIIEFIVDENDKRLDAWLSTKLEDKSRTYIQKIIEEGLVTVNEKVVPTKYKIKSGDKIAVTIPEPVSLDVKAQKIPLNIVYEDDDLVVVNKEKGMVVHPAAGNHEGTLVNALLEHCGSSLSDINGVIRPGIVHRIDKDTTGILVVAKSNRAHEKLSQLFKMHDIKRVYYALVDGIINEDSGLIDAPIARHKIERKKMNIDVNMGRRAVTRFKVIERFEKNTLISLELETGRTHQIRVHLAYIKHPVTGDTVYGKKSSYETYGQALHAKTLGFVHPVTNEYMEFDSDLPAYMQNLLNNLRRQK